MRYSEQCSIIECTNNILHDSQKAYQDVVVEKLLTQSRYQRPFMSVLSSISFASLILLARYGEPPLSGWLANIICR